MAAGSGSNHYAVLGIGANATVSEIRVAFRRQAKDAHPDAGGDPERFRRLREAHDTLVDPVRRRDYDEQEGIVHLAPGTSGAERFGWSGRSGDFTGDVTFPTWLRDVAEAPWTGGGATDDAPPGPVVASAADRAWWWSGRATVAPVVASGVVLLCAGDLVACCDAWDGNEAWRAHLGAAVVAPPVVVGSMVVVVSADGRAHGLDVGSGVTRWEHRLGASATGGLAVSGDTAIVGASARLVAIAADDGSRRWSTRLPSDPLRVSPVPGGAVVATAGGTVHCVEPARGQARWWIRARLEDVAPCVVGTALWLVGSRGQLLRFDVRTGAAALEVEAGLAVSGLATDGSLLFAAVSGPAGLVALNPQGVSRWSLELPAVASAPVVHDGLLQVIGSDASLRSVEAHSGREVGRAGLGFDPAGPPVLAAGRVVVPDAAGTVWALVPPVSPAG